MAGKALKVVLTSLVAAWLVRPVFSWATDWDHASPVKKWTVLGLTFAVLAMTSRGKKGEGK